MGLINCSKNPLTEKLDALKGQLDGLLDDITAAGNSALAGLSDKIFETATIFGYLAIILAAVNIFGGFLVTQRMLQMYKKKKK